MRTPSGELHVVDFKTEQIVASIQPKDYWDDKRHWEIKNNIDTLEFRVFDNTRHSSTLMQQNLVLKEVRDGRIVPYVITEIEKNSDDRSVMAYASGEWIQLAKAGIIPPQKLEGKTVIEMMDIALAGTKWKKGNLEYASFRSMTIDEFIDPLSFLKKIASLFELEIQYRAEVVGSQIVGRYIDMVKKRGRETGKEITLGKDLLGIKRIENSQNICTALLGFVKKEGGEFVTITEINGGVPYLVDSDAFQRWNEKGQHKFGFYSPETENEDMDSKRLMTLMNTELKKRVNSSIFYEVEAQSIGRVFGLNHELINDGDTIRIKDTGFTPKLYLEARAIAGDESYKNPLQDKYVFGDYHEIVDPNEELRKIYNRILSSLGNKQEMIDQLDKLVNEANETANNAKKESEAAKTLAEKVQENIKNNTVEIIESKYPPTTGLKDRKTLWLDISNGKPGILKLWKDGIWDPVVPDVESVKKETLEQVNQDIESTKSELNQKVQTVESKAQEIAGQIVDVQKQVNNKVDQTWIDSQLKDKADKTGVYTKDEIKDGFIGKQVYETDKQGNVQKFRDINTSIGQTNEALTQKAEKTELKKTNEGLSQLEQKTNEIKTTADGTKQILTDLKTQVDNINIGVRNLIDGTEFTNANGWSRWGNYGAVSVINEVTLSSLPTPYSLKIETVVDEKLQVIPNGTPFGVQSNGHKFKVKKGQDYTVSFNVATSELGWVLDYIYVMYSTEGGNQRIPNINTLDFPIVVKINDRQNNNYYKVSFTFKADRDDDQAYLLIGGNTKRTLDGANGYAWIRINALKVEEGNVPTTWTLAPEDQVSTTDFTKKTVEIETSIKGINNTVSNVQSEQGKLTERITKSEQTVDGFKTSIEALTKKDGEISNKLNTVESTVEGTKKTISDVQQTTSELTKTTTEIKEEAGRTKERMEQINSKVDGLEVGATNLIDGSEFINASGWSRWSTIGSIRVLDQSGLKDALPYPRCLLVESQEGGKQLAVPNNTPFGVQGNGRTFSVRKDQKYTVSMNVATSELGHKLDYTYIMYTDKANQKIPEINILSFPFVAKISDRENNNYYRVKFTFTATKDDDKVYILIGGRTKRELTGSNGYAWIRVNALKVEKGSIATDWDTSNNDKVSLQVFEQKTTDIEKSVDGVKTSVTNVQNSQDGFEKRMSTVEQTATGLSSTVSNLNNIVSDQGKKLTEANTKIEQQATAINAKVELKQVEDYVAGFKIPELKQTVNQNKELLLDELANKLATEQFNQKMTLIDNRFTINEQGINAAAKRTEVYTRIQADGQFAKDSYVRDLEGRIHITETNILSTVKKGDIISAINQTAETIKIKAGKIELDGTTIAKHLEAQELRGTTIRTDNGINYVHIQKQFIRLMESNISRVYLGYYKDRTSQIQPTVVLGGDSDFQDGSVVLSKQPTQGFLGIINGKDSNGEPYFVSSVVFKRSGELNLNAGMNGNVTVKAGIGINHYAQGGSYWVEATGGIGLKGGNKNVLIDSRTAIVFSLKDKNMLDVVDYNGDTDLRFQTLTLRNGASSYAGKLQVKSGAGTSFSPVVASNFETSSQRKYKTNIRDVQFSALEKIMALNIQQYNLKTDMEQLYEMRMNRQDNDPVLTTNDIQTRYGWIADDESNPECFVTKEKNAAEIYSSIALQIKAFQEEKHAKDAEIEELKEENKQMNRRIEVLEQLLVQNLIDKKPEQL
ncbi:tail fiber domain-containing protein [Bacillus sp. ZJS3]|uniref:phage tail spike protein n=1 Tax=Bacillus sp. ZJS3 TaxID=2928154 RepID=UPI001FB1D868|nr:phage tail spike protein [Bacillus sp. ZJS3]UOB80783.1 tail fiber domain-containing protein [Bacillus sp. ZJS3]